MKKEKEERRVFKQIPAHGPGDLAVYLVAYCRQEQGKLWRMCDMLAVLLAPPRHLDLGEPRHWTTLHWLNLVCYTDSVRGWASSVLLHHPGGCHWYGAYVLCMDSNSPTIPRSSICTLPGLLPCHHTHAHAHTHTHMLSFLCLNPHVHPLTHPHTYAFRIIPPHSFKANKKKPLRDRRPVTINLCLCFCTLSCSTSLLLAP